MSGSARASVEALLAWLDERTGREPAIHQYRETRLGVPVTVFRYDGLPEEGDLLAFTFGVSEPRAAGAAGTELVLCVRSADPAWALALCSVGARLQGLDPAPGETLDFGTAVSAESAMSGFVLWEPLVVAPGDDVVHLADGHLVLVQVIPVHDSELRALRAAAGDERAQAVRSFVAGLGESVYDVRRPPSA